MDTTSFNYFDPQALATRVTVTDGFPRPEWHSIDRWIDQNVDAGNKQIANDEAVLCWLEMVKGYCGGSFEVYASDRFYLLCPFEEDMAHRLVWFADNTWRKVNDFLRLLEVGPVDGQKVIIAFDDYRQYYTYISYFYPEGNFGSSGGLHIRSGHAHAVLTAKEPWQFEVIISHELTHVFLSTLTLPLWIEEGLAQAIEQFVVGHQTPILNAERKERHITYWQENGLDKFWSGEAFSQADEGQELAYELARVMVRNMAVDFYERFFDFVGDAKLEDAGMAAAREHLKCCVSDCAAEFLGDGDWRPNPEALRNAVEYPQA